MTAPQTPGPMRATHQPFSWFIDAPYNSQDEFIALTKNVCDGLQICLEMVHSTTLDSDEEAQSLLTDNDVDRLMRFAIAAAGMMSNEADRRIERINDRRRRENKID